jgi:sugar-specific transcriptional regulator TrmB
MQSIFEDMKRLGFSEYEVKAYMSLLEQYPLTGYGLSKISGIPRSRIYEILGNLEEKGIVFKESDGETNVYYPLEPKLLVVKLKRDLDKIISHVQTYTSERFNRNQEDKRMISLKGYAEIIGFVELLIGQAEERVAVSIWEKESDLLLAAMKEAEVRGVSVKGVYFGNEAPLRNLVCHRRRNRYLAEKKERHISIVIDGEQVITGIISRGEASRVSWIRDPGFAEMSEDYISHDVMINAYSEYVIGSVKEEFEHFSDEARRDYYEYDEATFDEWKYQED